MTCEVCGRDFSWSGRGRRPSACGQRCRKRRQRAAVPAALTGLDRWTARDGKRPTRPDGRAASSTDPSTWSPHRAVAHGPCGIMLGDGLACWDLDDVLDDGGVLSADGAAVLAEVGESALWVERSISGRGLHVFVHGGGPSKQTKRVSYYSHSRFIAVTGQRFTR